QACRAHLAERPAGQKQLHHRDDEEHPARGHEPPGLAGRRRPKGARNRLVEHSSHSTRVPAAYTRPVAPVTSRQEVAQTLFAPLGPTYDRYARLLSFGQDPRWRRFLVSRVEATPTDALLDGAAGTGAVAAELTRRRGCTIVGLDQSPEMLAVARQRLPATVRLVLGEADDLPFPDASFAGLTFTYLMRYVDDPAATL